MSLAIETFAGSNGRPAWRPGNNFGGTTLFKALGHPVTARKAKELVARLVAQGPIAIYDPLGQAQDFDNFYHLDAGKIAGVFVQNVEKTGLSLFGQQTRPVSALNQCACKTVLVTAFDAGRFIDHIRHLVPKGAAITSFDDIRLDDAMLTNKRDYLAPVNFATNFALLRDEGGLHTRVVTANYWSGYGAKDPALWFCLFDGAGKTLAEWFEPLGPANSTIVVDSREVRKKFGLKDFCGSLFIHAVRIAGHDIVKYALDVFGDDQATLSCTHDANAWPADLYAGMPAPDEDETLVLYVQNSHPVAIPPRAIGLNLVGSQDIAWLEEAIAPFATYELDAGKLLPAARWPDQIEIQAGRYFVRPRYEVVRGNGRRRIAHANVERTDLKNDPAIPSLEKTMGKGYLMPLPVLPLKEFKTVTLPTPMATCQDDLPLSILLYDANGAEIARRRLGCIPRRESRALDMDAWLDEEGKKLPSGYGHVEYVYDFHDGGAADGWLHALGRFEQRASGHRAETIFGAHIYNTQMVYKDEPQSYATRPPGLSTRIFLRLGHDEKTDTLCHLIYPASTPWHAHSQTKLILHNALGEAVAEKEAAIACSGSLHWRYHAMFDEKERRAAGPNAYVLIRDATCRLFGFHGLLHPGTSFCLDHMFGF